ncbi:MAG: hypothetical protein RR543_03965, partial [Erysipelotrichales bacterium]
MKKNLKSILAAFLFFMVATINVSAWDGQAATEPEIKNDVYQIKTAEDLAWFATKVNSENTVNAKLINDIDLSSKAWTPISTYKGTFDGNGKTISNLSLETPTAQAGLFAKNEGTIKDFKLTGKIISKKNMVGSVVGWNSGGTVSGITSDVLIEISSSNIDTQGGIVGQSTINSKVINNVFNGSLINTLPSGGAKKAGGIVGLNNNGSVIGNINNGRVEGPKGTAAGETGGIVAFTQFSGDGMKSHVYNNINNGEVVVASTNASSAGIVGNINATSSQNNSILIFINNLNTGKFSTEGVKISGPLYGSKSTYAKLNVVNNYFLADNTDYVTGAVSKADLQTQEAVDKLNSNDGSEYGLTIPEESKYVFKEGSMPGLTFVKEEEGPDTSVEDQKRVDEAATKINSSLYNLKPEFGKDTNVNALVKAQLVKLGFDDVNVSVKTSDDINYVGLDGAIKYFYSNPNGSNMMWFKSVPVEFNITKNKASAQHNKNAVIHWDMDKLEATTKTEIVDKIGSDNMKKDNPDLDNVTSNLDLPQHIDGKKWARITWTSSDTNIITVDTSNTSNPSHFYDPYIGKVKQSYDDKIVTLTATTKNNLVQTGQKDLIIPKDIKVTVKGVGASLSDKMQKDLDDNYTYDKLKLSKTGETLNKDNVTGDIKFPQPKETGVPDYNNYQFIVISNDPDLIANGYRGSVYRPLPGQQAKEVEFSVKMKHRNYDVAVTKDLKVTLAPLTQAEIDKEVSNMDIVKKSYFDGLNKGVNKDKNNISENLTTFQQAHVGADNKITWITNYKDQKEGGIVPVDIDITRPSEQWNLFHSSNPSVIEHEVLRVHQPAKDTKVTIKSTLSSGEYAKYATRYPDNEQFKKLNRQDVNVEVNVLGKDGGVDPEVPTKAKVSVVVEGNESTLLEETKVEVEAKDISDIVGGNASDWKERPTAMHALVKALEAKGYNVK